MRLLLALLLLFALPAAALAKQPMVKPKTKHEVQEPVLIPNVPPVTVTFDAYVGGIHLVTANVTYEEQNGLYRARGAWEILRHLVQNFPVGYGAENKRQTAG